MSDYRAMTESERGVALPRVRVGEIMDTNKTLSASHPVYLALTDKMEGILRNVVTRESERRATAAQAVVSVSLTSEQRNDVKSAYPEFRVVWAQLENPVHAVWTAHRQMVNQYMLLQTAAYPSNVLHYGGTALGSLSAGRADVIHVVDESDSCAMHESHGDDVNCTRMLTFAGTAAAELGWQVSEALRGAYLSRKALIKLSSRAAQQQCTEASLVGGAAATAVIVDGSLYSLSPYQFASAMFEAGADVGYFSLPYTPAMYVTSVGELPGTEVAYQVSDLSVDFRYPQGLAGVTRYEAYTWHQWIMNTVRTLPGSGGSYQYELMGPRGPFMVVRVVRVRDAQVGATFVHSVSLPTAEPMVVVRAPQLKSLAADPWSPSSWVDVEVVVPERVVEKVHDAAMSFTAEEFSRYAILKRIETVNNRVVIQGTSVKVNSPLTHTQINVLVNAIYTHCFVMRYESNALSVGLRAAIDKVAAFGTMSFAGKVYCVSVAALSYAYDWTLGGVDDVVRSFADTARRWLSQRYVDKGNSFTPAPVFVRFESIVSSERVGILDKMRAMVGLFPRNSQLHRGVVGSGFWENTGFSRSESDQEVEAGYNPDMVGEVFNDIAAVGEPGEVSSAGHALYTAVRGLNDFQQDPGDRHLLVNTTFDGGRPLAGESVQTYQVDPDYVRTLDEVHEAIFPGVAQQEYMYDQFSISMDDQDRTLSTLRMEMPLDFGTAPSSRKVYASKLHAYAVTKRASSVHETLSGLAARNLADPMLALPQHDDDLVEQVWRDFLEVACVPEAEKMLAQYQSDPVELEEAAFGDWTKKARAETVSKIIKHLIDNPQSWEEMRLDHYSAMIKSDVKPPLSTKPIYQRVEPQMIVYHLPEINSIFSSVFRVLVRRLLSLLKPNFMVNLLKDMGEIENMAQTHHDWGASFLSFLECDFSKYDKSQGQWALKMECFVYRMLGMNEYMLERWRLAHVDCKIRDLSAAISLSVRYQRKSGDATTALGNVIINLMSVVHVYKGSDIVWLVVMGDDSLVCVRSIVGDTTAVEAFAQKFNLIAKYYITQAPYFASTFFLFNRDEKVVSCVPDPIKRIEKWSMAVSAHDPKWEDRYRSAVDKLGVYRYKQKLVGLSTSLLQRYTLGEAYNVEAVSDAIATAVSSPTRFRELWEEVARDVLC